MRSIRILFSIYIKNIATHNNIKYSICKYMYVGIQMYNKIKSFPKFHKNQLHDVSRTQQGRQREPSVKTLCSTFCRILEELRVEWQNSTPHLPSTPERRNGNINLNKYFTSPRLLRHDWPQKLFPIFVYKENSWSFCRGKTHIYSY